MSEGCIIKIKAGNVNIEAGDSLLLNEGRFVKIMVADQGIGIHQDHLQKIFGPYFTTKPKGSGLGLAITYSIIKNTMVIFVLIQRWEWAQHSIYTLLLAKWKLPEKLKERV